MAVIKQFGTLNRCYLIAGRTGNVLVDTGPVSMRKMLEPKLEKYPPDFILLTHGHADHIGNAAYFAKKFGCEIGMHYDDCALIQDPNARPVKTLHIGGKLLRQFTKKAEMPEPFAPDRFLIEGDTLEDFGIRAIIHELPGHTKGSIGVLIEGVHFLVGDALMHLAGVSLPFQYEDERQTRMSAKFIKRSHAKKLYFGHGLPAKNEHIPV